MEKVEEVKGEGVKTEDIPSVQNDAKLALKSFNYKWTCENFSKCLNFADASVYSPEFEFENATWRFSMHVISKDNQLKEIKIRPCKVNKNEINHFLKYSVSICDDQIGPLATKTAESKIENDAYPRISFKLDEEDNFKTILENETLRSVLKKDKLIFNIDILGLAAIPCDQKNVEQAEKKNAKQRMVFTSKFGSSGNSKRPKYSVTDSERLIFGLIILTILPIIAFTTIDTEVRRKEAKLINELIIDTTLKVYDIAEAFNFTEIKYKSVELLSSYHKLIDDVSGPLKVDKEKYFNIITAERKEEISA